MMASECLPSACLCYATPADYRWSSHRANAWGDNDPVLTSHPLFLSLAGSAEERRDMYRRMLGQPVPEDAIKAIRDATQFEWALGDIAFRERAEARTGR